MRRREFLHDLALLSMAQALPLAALGAEMPPWHVGFDGVDRDMPPLAMRVRGSIPEPCYGTLYRNGPALYARAGQRYEHWFDPDGMVQAFALSPQGVSHRGRFVRTRRFVEEQAEGRFLYGGAGTQFPNGLPERNNETTNVANINVQPMAGELLALWEAGSAYRIDPVTLETLGRREWSEELSAAPFSAHPRFDEQGQMWNIGSVPFVASPMLVLYRISSTGKLISHRIHNLDFAGYMHDFVLTPRYLIALNSSAVFSEGETFVDRMHWEPDRASQLLVFSRHDLSLLATLDIPATFVFHFGSAWEEGAEISFTACEYPDMSIVSRGMPRLAQRQPGPYHPAPQLVRYAVSLSPQRVSKQNLGIAMEFPGHDRRDPFASHPLIGVGGHETSASSLGSAVLRVDPRSGEHARFDYGDGVIVEEPVFVPDASGALGAGYVVHGFLDYRRRQSGLSILDAEQLPQGPIAQATMDRVMPLGFHGCFLPTRT